MQKLVLSSLGGQATPACRAKTPLTRWVHAELVRPYWYEPAVLKRYGWSPVHSKASDSSYASTKGWMAAGSVEICGP